MLTDKTKQLFLISFVIGIIIGILELFFFNRISYINNFFINNDKSILIELIVLSSLLFLFRVSYSGINILLANNIFVDLNKKILFIIYHSENSSNELNKNLVYTYTHIIRIIAKSSNQIQTGISSIFVILFLVVAALQNMKDMSS